MLTIDLHTHTTASDGTLTPTELVIAAAEEGLTVIGITDHDTLDGLEEAMEAARQLNIEVVAGIELSIDYPHGRFHMLGYLLDIHSKTLTDRLRLLKENRSKRNLRMVEKMQQIGISITMQDVEKSSGHGQIGRPHMAIALVKKGVVSSVQEAFNLYLAEGGLAYVPKDKITMEEGIQLIHSAKGLAVLAHPSTLKIEGAEMMDALVHFRHAGLDGMECYYSQYKPELIDEYLTMACNAGLLVTGGSDFHGATKPGVFLGHIIRSSPAPNALLCALKQRRQELFFPCS
jgi:predicted metal-dependent phosphoesterase TrpH